MRHASSAEEAISLIKNASIDLLIADFGLPKMSGLDLIKNLKSEGYKGQIIVLSGSDNPQLFQQALELKVQALVHKTNSSETLKEAIRSCQDSTGTYIDPSVSRILKQNTGGTLSNRELKVLELMSQGLTSKEIAGAINCSITTVKTYKVRMLNKSGARNSAELLAWFLTQGNSNFNTSSSS